MGHLQLQELMGAPFMQPEHLQLGITPMTDGKYYTRHLLQEKEKMVFQKWIKCNNMLEKIDFFIGIELFFMIKIKVLEELK